MATRSGEPPTHGKIQLSVSRHAPGLKPSHARKHLSMMVETTNTTKDYGAHGTGFSSQGSLTSSGSSNADYSTGSADSVGDSDSGGPSGY